MMNAGDPRAVGTSDCRDLCLIPASFGYRREKSSNQTIDSFSESFVYCTRDHQATEHREVTASQKNFVQLRKGSYVLYNHVRTGYVSPER